jgi:hypothetical protein
MAPADTVSGLPPARTLARVARLSQRELAESAGIPVSTYRPLRTATNEQPRRVRLLR